MINPYDKIKKYRAVSKFFEAAPVFLLLKSLGCFGIIWLVILSVRGGAL